MESSKRIQFRITSLEAQLLKAHKRIKHLEDDSINSSFVSKENRTGYEPNIINNIRDDDKQHKLLLSNENIKLREEVLLQSATIQQNTKSATIAQARIVELQNTLEDNIDIMNDAETEIAKFRAERDEAFDVITQYRCDVEHLSNTLHTTRDDNSHHVAELQQRVESAQQALRNANTLHVSDAKTSSALIQQLRDEVNYLQSKISEDLLSTQHYEKQQKESIERLNIELEKKSLQLQKHSDENDALRVKINDFQTQEKTLFNGEQTRAENDGDSDTFRGRDVTTLNEDGDELNEFDTLPREVWDVNEHSSVNSMNFPQLQQRIEALDAELATQTMKLEKKSDENDELRAELKCVEVRNRNNNEVCLQAHHNEILQATQAQKNYIKNVCDVLENTQFQLCVYRDENKSLRAEIECVETQRYHATAALNTALISMSHYINAFGFINASYDAVCRQLTNTNNSHRSPSHCDDDDDDDDDDGDEDGDSREQLHVAVACRNDNVTSLSASVIQLRAELVAVVSEYTDKFACLEMQLEDECVRDDNDAVRMALLMMERKYMALLKHANELSDVMMSIHAVCVMMETTVASYKTEKINLDTRLVEVEKQRDALAQLDDDVLIDNEKYNVLQQEYNTLYKRLEILSTENASLNRQLSALNSEHFTVDDNDDDEDIDIGDDEDIDDDDDDEDIDDDDDDDEDKNDDDDDDDATTFVERNTADIDELVLARAEIDHLQHMLEVSRQQVYTTTHEHQADIDIAIAEAELSAEESMAELSVLRTQNTTLVALIEELQIDLSLCIERIVHLETCVEQHQNEYNQHAVEYSVQMCVYDDTLLRSHNTIHTVCNSVTMILNDSVIAHTHSINHIHTLQTQLQQGYLHLQHHIDMCQQFATQNSSLNTLITCFTNALHRSQTMLNNTVTVVCQLQYVIITQCAIINTHTPHTTPDHVRRVEHDQLLYVVYQRLTELQHCVTTTMSLRDQWRRERVDLVKLIEWLCVCITQHHTQHTALLATLRHRVCVSDDIVHMMMMASMAKSVCVSVCEDERVAALAQAQACCDDAESVCVVWRGERNEAEALRVYVAELTLCVKECGCEHKQLQIKLAQRDEQYVQQQYLMAKLSRAEMQLEETQNAIDIEQTRVMKMREYEARHTNELRENLSLAVEHKQIAEIQISEFKQIVQKTECSLEEMRTNAIAASLKEAEMLQETTELKFALSEQINRSRVTAKQIRVLEAKNRLLDKKLTMCN